MSNSCHTFAIFDFDHTLTDRDSLLPFLFYINGFWKTICQLIFLIPLFFGFVLGLVSRQKTKEKILQLSIGGKSWKEVHEFGKRYAEEKLDGYLKPEAMHRLAWHQRQGHHCLLVSASLEFYLEAWAKRHGFETVLASRLELTPDKRITGNLEGLNCWGEEKKRRLLEYLDVQNENQMELFVYGDSQGDRAILAIANFPFYRKFK